MNNKSKIMSCILSAIAILVIILDAKTAFDGAFAGITLCMQTVVPSLLPLFVLSSYLSGNLYGKTELLKPLGKFCRMPAGTEQILLIGLLGGYPVGAKCISEAYSAGYIQKTDARRMLGFCSNAGPAFIFGMAGFLFADVKICFLLWLIHIASVIITGCLLPGTPVRTGRMLPSKGMTLSKSLEKCIRSMALVCGWIVLFRVLISFLQRWIIWLFPTEIQVVIMGALELSNGVLQLDTITSTGLRFLLLAALLGFGGICVTMQTASVTGELGTGYYFPGKVIQCCISFLLASLIQFILFPPDLCWFSLPVLICVAVVVVLTRSLLARNQKKVVAFCI